MNNMYNYEDYFWEEDTISSKNDKYLTLVIYDISNNRDRLKMVKLLQSYGFRVQKSAFEALLNTRKFEKLKNEIQKIINENDNIKIYRLKGVSETFSFGTAKDIQDEDVLII